MASLQGLNGMIVIKGELYDATTSTMKTFQTPTKFVVFSTYIIALRPGPEKALTYIRVLKLPTYSCFSF